MQMLFGMRGPAVHERLVGENIFNACDLIAQTRGLRKVFFFCRNPHLAFDLRDKFCFSSTQDADDIFDI